MAKRSLALCLVSSLLALPACGSNSESRTDGKDAGDANESEPDDSMSSLDGGDDDSPEPDDSMSSLDGGDDDSPEPEVEPDNDTTDDDDTDDEPEPVDLTWGCLGDATPVASDNEVFTVLLRINDMVSQEPLPGMAVKLCSKLDVACSVPIDELQSDDDGLLELQLPGGFDGYALLEDPSFAPSLYFFNPPIRHNQTARQWPITSPFVAAAIASQAGGQFNEERGLVLLVTQDCQGQLARGIRYDSPDTNAEARSFYVIDGQPTSSATATDASGSGGLVNVNPGALTIRAEIVESSETVGTLNLLVRGGAITHSRIVPDVP